MEEGKAIAAMSGGDGVYSYSKNSEFQRKAIHAVKDLIDEAIAENLDINIISNSSNTFRIADLGCATGPNTFVAVQNIIDAIVLKCSQTKEETSLNLPEFQVFFNDQASNDFNQLFASLPSERTYFAAGLPGSFFSKLFPKASLHFVHSSYSLNILSGVPIEVLDKTSSAWNEGHIHYSGSNSHVLKAYQAQYENDMECFLKYRAQEIVPGGLLAFVVPGRPNGSPHSETFYSMGMEVVESCLIDLANKGKISKEKIDLFNFPAYFASLEEVEKLVKRNGCFSMEIMETVPQERPPLKIISLGMRAGVGGIIKENFGEEILDELFDLTQKKFEENATAIFESGNSVNLFVLLKRI